ncbi:MAG: hypothetical protein DCF22_25675 [Leptolyngbya sp.]|nr:MAG: hypothetical protein DCF22_25675 [Leptolyngbya sp.]
MWHAIDPASGTVLADVLASHQDEAFIQLKILLEPFVQFYTDGWGAYERHLDPSLHTVGQLRSCTSLNKGLPREPKAERKGVRKNKRTGHGNLRLRRSKALR